jgi:hypothetical protein
VIIISQLCDYRLRLSCRWRPISLAGVAIGSSPWRFVVRDLFDAHSCSPSSEDLSCRLADGCEVRVGIGDDGVRVCDLVFTA